MNRPIASEPRVLHEADGFVYLTATGTRADQIAHILSESFSCEPMAAALGVSAADLLPMMERFMPECTGNGLSAIAVPEDEPDTVAGAFICRDYRSPLPEGVPDEFPWFFPVGQALMTVGEVYETAYPDLQPGDAVDLWMVGVPPGRFARRGIAGNLFRICTDLARTAGFGRCVTECTGYYSQAAARRAGFTEIARLSYEEFRFDGKAVFAGMPPPHTHLVLYDQVLQLITPSVSP